LVVTPTSGFEGNVTVDVAAAAAQDLVGNASTAAAQSVQAVDTKAPTVTVSDDRATTTNGAITYTFTFSEAVTGFTEADVTVANGTKGAFAGSGAVYTLVVTPTSGFEGNVTVDVAAATSQDLVGNASTAAAQSVQAVDTKAPTVTVSDDRATTTNGAITYTFTFSEGVTGFTEADVTVANGTKGAFAGSGAVYTLVVTPTSGFEGDVAVDVAAAAAQDLVGNASTAAAQSVQAVDTKAPTVTVSDDRATTTNGAITYTFTFSEAVTGFTEADVTVANGTKGAFAGSDAVYTLVVTPTSGFEGDVTVDVAAAAAQDLVGNASTAAAQSVQAVDTKAPTVTVSDDRATTTNGAITYTFTFSEAVTGFTADDVTVGNGTKGAFAGSGAVYTLVVTPTSGFEGNVTVDVAPATSQDLAGNASTAAAQSVQAVDTKAPTVTVSDDRATTTNGAITYTFTFSEGVTGFTEADVTVANGTKGAFAGSGAVYTLVVTPTSGFEGDVTVDVAAAAAQDLVGNASTAAAQSVQAVDTKAPTVTVSDDRATTTNGAITYTFTFSEAVTGFTADDVTVGNGTKGAFAGSGAVYTLVVTPTAGFEGNVTVDVAASAASDTAGNVSTAATQSVQAVDTKAPTTPTIDLVAGDDTIGAGELTSAVAGSAEAFASVLLTLGLNNVRTVTANGEGRWTYQLTSADLGAMGNGPETLLATAVDAAGNSSAQGSRLIQVDLPQPTFTSAVDNVTNLDVTSAIVLTVSEPVTAVAGKKITIMNDGGTGFRGEAGDNDQVIDVSSASVTIQGNRIIIRPPVNLDLANDYHLEIDAGAFVGASGLGNAAVSEPSAMNFSTVAPGSGLAGVGSATASQAMDTATGGLKTSFKWLDIEGVGNPSSDAGTSLNLIDSDIALVFKDYDAAAGNVGAATDGIGAPDLYVRALNFGPGDMVYVDNQSVASPNLFTQTTVLADTPDEGITQLSFAGVGGLGAVIEIDLAGSDQVFESFDDLAVLLAVNYNPVGELTPPSGT
jgi:hypothetical protein